MAKFSMSAGRKARSKTGEKRSRKTSYVMTRSMPIHTPHKILNSIRPADHSVYKESIHHDHMSHVHIAFQLCRVLPNSTPPQAPPLAYYYPRGVTSSQPLRLATEYLSHSTLHGRNGINIILIKRTVVRKLLDSSRV
nr:hypothetical protein CFP56_20967 [Quercus suber]